MKHFYNFITRIWRELNRFTERHSQLIDMYAKASLTHQPPLF